MLGVFNAGCYGTNPSNGTQLHAFIPFSIFDKPFDSCNSHSFCISQPFIPGQIRDQASTRAAELSITSTCPPPPELHVIQNPINPANTWPGHQLYTTCGPRPQQPKRQPIARRSHKSSPDFTPLWHRPAAPEPVAGRPPDPWFGAWPLTFNVPAA